MNRQTIIVLMKKNTRNMNGGWNCPLCCHYEQEYSAAYAHSLCCAHKKLGNAVPSISRYSA